jgi:hypothetical protein
LSFLVIELRFDEFANRRTRSNRSRDRRSSGHANSIDVTDESSQPYKNRASRHRAVSRMKFASHALRFVSVITTRREGAMTARGGKSASIFVNAFDADDQLIAGEQRCLDVAEGERFASPTGAAAAELWETPFAH